MNEQSSGMHSLHLTQHTHTHTWRDPALPLRLGPALRAIFKGHRCRRRCRCHRSRGSPRSRGCASPTAPWHLRNRHKPQPRSASPPTQLLDHWRTERVSSGFGLVRTEDGLLGEALRRGDVPRRTMRQCRLRGLLLALVGRAAAQQNTQISGSRWHRWAVGQCRPVERWGEGGHTDAACAGASASVRCTGPSPRGPPASETPASAPGTQPCVRTPLEQSQR